VYFPYERGPGTNYIELVILKIVHMCIICIPAVKWGVVDVPVCAVFHVILYMYKTEKDTHAHGKITITVRRKWTPEKT
jgi:hypothetical protein